MGPGGWGGRCSLQRAVGGGADVWVIVGLLFISLA